MYQYNGTYTQQTQLTRSLEKLVKLFNLSILKKSQLDGLLFYL